MKGKHYFLQEVFKTIHGNSPWYFKSKRYFDNIGEKMCDLNNFNRSILKIVTVPRVTSHPNFLRKKYYYNYKKGYYISLI